MTKKREWKKDNTAKSVQVAFELEQQIARTIHVLAAQEGLTPSNMIRKMIGLSYSAPKRPRLTLSLTPDDYQQLGEKYSTSPDNSVEIKRQIIQELIEQIPSD
jgi:hypothetical protein